MAPGMLLVNRLGVVWISALAPSLCLLGFNDDTLKFLKDNELLVGRINFRIPLFFTREEPYLLQTLQFTLDIAWVFFNELGKTADMCTEVRILRIDDDNLPADP